MRIRAGILVGFILIVLTYGFGWAGSGGPDADGYRWIDSREPGGPTFTWVEISPRCGGNGIVIAQGDDKNSGLVTILPPGGFSYRRNIYANLAVCSNGWLSFSEGVDSSYSGRVPDSLPPNNVLALLWTDLLPIGGSYGNIYYLRDTLGGRNRTIVEWDSVAGFNSGTFYKFEVLLDATNSNVIYQYKYSDNWSRSTASIGMENGSGKTGLGVSQSNLSNSYAVKFYTDISHNVGVARIVRPNTYETPLSTLMPNAWVKNYGTTTDTFPLFCKIDSAGTQIYLSQRQATGLRPGDTLLVKFDFWTVGPDSNQYGVKFYTALPGDPDPTNDTLKVTVNNHGQRGWLPARNMGDSINTSSRDYSPTLTGDGNHLILASNRPGTYGGWDLWMADRVSGDVWRSPANLGPVINTANAEQDPWISSDGNLLVFASDRPGGYGAWDLWLSRKVGGDWQTPVNMGPVINGSNWESTSWMSPDTLRLYYGIYQRSGGLGGWDIWMSTKEGGVWTDPVNLGSNINGSNLDSSPTLTADEQTLYFDTNGTGNADIYCSRKVGGQWQPKQDLGLNINTVYNDFRPWITGDGQKIIFTSDRPGGRGSEDLYFSEQGISGTEHQIPLAMPSTLTVGTPKPNPSNRGLSIALELSAPAKVEAGIYNVAGQKVKALIQNTLTGGHHEVAWDERDQKGIRVYAGIYFFRIQAGEVRITRKITILR
jgi:FlgD Ig-like domain/WD40-like Beta Propeller Repeat